MKRFVVPYKLRAKNREAVILGDEPILSLEFIFEDEGGNAPVERGTLLQALSQGEKKALSRSQDNVRSGDSPKGETGNSICSR